MASQSSTGKPGSRRPETVQLMGKKEFDSVFASWRDMIRESLRASTGDSKAAGRAGGAPWALVGIKRRGAVLAHRLWDDLGRTISPLHYGEVDISLYRDDYYLHKEQPQVLGTEISFPVDGTRILLVDDVLYTGRTVRAAMDLILDFGRPKGILLAVFLDRGHRELPIAANFVGREIVTAGQDLVRVRLKEMGMGVEDGVEIVRLDANRGLEETRT